MSLVSGKKKNILLFVLHDFVYLTFSYLAWLVWFGTSISWSVSFRVPLKTSPLI